MTTPARILVDLAAHAGRARLRHALHEAQRAQLVSVGQLNATLRQLALPGRAGVRLLADLLDEWGPGLPIPASELERRLLLIIHRRGLPEPVRQFPFPGRQAVTGCVDFSYPVEQILLEADERRWHSRLEDFAQDRLRDREAARAGWTTLRFVHAELTGDDADTIAETLHGRRRTTAA